MIAEEILVLNDGSLLLQIMSYLLETRGCRLNLTDSPEEALVLLNARNIQMVLVKLNGKQLDRLSLMHMVKELNADTKLIILADKACLPAEIFEIEAEDYLLLPCRMAEIWRRLSLHLEPFLWKPGAYRDKSLAYLVDRRIWRNLDLMFQEMQHQAASVARGWNLIKLKLNGVEGEARAAIQETFKRTQTLIEMSEDFCRNFLYENCAQPSPGIIDIQQEAVPPAVKGAETGAANPGAILNSQPASNPYYFFKSKKGAS